MINLMIMKKLESQIEMVVEKTDTGFSAFSKEYPIFTTGRTIPDLLQNALEGANLFFEDQNIEIEPQDIKLELDFKQFFNYYNILNSKILAKRIGMNPTLLSQYVRGHKKPSAEQTEKILSGIHQIGQELSEINLIYRH